MSSTPTPSSKKSPQKPIWLDTLVRLYSGDDNPWPAAITYLLLLTLAEITTVFVSTQVGILLNLSIMFLLLVHAALVWEKPIHGFLLSLVLVPLIRIVSLSLPLIGIALPYWYLITSIPLFAAAVVIMRQIGLPWSDLGWGGHHWWWQLPIAASGLLLGYLEYNILKPEPLVDTFTLQNIWLPALILLISTGYLEELIFRRIMQRTAVSQLGIRLGIVYVAFFFAVLHIGYRSISDFIFVLIVGLAFGVVVQLTDNIVGVTLAHGLTNISLFLIFPFLLAEPQTPLVPLAQSSPPSVSTIVAETNLTTLTATATPRIEKTATPTSISTATTNIFIVKTTSPTARPLSETPTTMPSPTVSTATPLAPTATKLTHTPTISATIEKITLNTSTGFSNLNVRSGPGLDYPVWAMMAPNQAYEILGQDVTQEWLVICCFAENQPGWVLKTAVTLAGNEADLADLVPPAPQVKVDVVRLNARTEPSAESASAGILLQDERYDLISQDKTGDWYQICCVADSEVWVFAGSVTVWGDLGNVPVYQEQATTISGTDAIFLSLRDNMIWLVLLIGGACLSAFIVITP